MIKHLLDFIRSVVGITLLILVAHACLAYVVGHRVISPPIYTQDFAVLPGIPPVTQESIDIALKHFEIQQPWNLTSVLVVDDLGPDTRAIATIGLVLPICRVVVGPHSFSSWGMLGSTLAHEIEVHCNQNITLLWWQRVFYGQEYMEMLAECPAYLYEVNGHRRFNLSLEEIIDVSVLMNLYCQRIPRD